MAFRTDAHAVGLRPEAARETAVGERILDGATGQRIELPRERRVGHNLLGGRARQRQTGLGIELARRFRSVELGVGGDLHAWRRPALESGRRVLARAEGAEFRAVREALSVDRVAARERPERRAEAV